MTNPIERIKPAVRAITPYTLHPYRASIKVNQNENPFDMPAEIKEEVFRILRDRPWSRYPDFVPQELLDDLAKFAGWTSDGVLAGNGSNELIQSVLAVTVEPGVKVVVPEPTFTLYRQLVQVFGGQVVPVPLKPDLTFDIEALGAAAKSSGASVAVLCSPNNPTGARVDDGELVAFARGFDGIVVVDEAYHEFSGGTVVPLLRELPNLIVLRTFSKAMAMAGLRVGYMLASRELTSEVHKATLPYNVNFLSAAVARVACARFDLLKPYIEKIIRERDRLFRAVECIPGLTPVPTSANFFLVHTGMEPRQLFDRLLEHDVLVRDVSRYPMLSEYTRLSVGTPEENDIIIAALNRVMTAA